MVDFHRIALHQGSVVFVRPGEVQQWRPRRGLEADLLLIDPGVVQPSAMTFQHPAMEALRLEEWATDFKAEPGELSGWTSLATLLRRELDRPQLDAVSTAMARQLLLCLMLSVARSATAHAAPGSTQGALMRRFQRELDGLVASRPSVARLASRLRVSTSTLTRICGHTLGHSAKEAVDRRVALEAQRLLVHSGASSAAIGEQLGFSEPTNFLKFFKRLVGMTPEDFRQRHRPA